MLTFLHLILFCSLHLTFFCLLHSIMLCFLPSLWAIAEIAGRTGTKIQQLTNSTALLLGIMNPFFAENYQNVKYRFNAKE